MLRERERERQLGLPILGSNLQPFSYKSNTQSLDRKTCLSISIFLIPCVFPVIWVRHKAEAPSQSPNSERLVEINFFLPSPVPPPPQPLFFVLIQNIIVM